MHHHAQKISNALRQAMIFHPMNEICSPNHHLLDNAKASEDGLLLAFTKEK